MRRLVNGASGRRRRLWLAVSCVYVAAATVAVAFGVSSASATSSSIVSTINPLTPAAKCGATGTYRVQDPNGVLKTLSPAAQAAYSSWPFVVKSTPWKKFKGVKGPWKIGLITFPTNSPYMVDLVNQAKVEFAKAKAKGLVKGSLLTYIQPSFATATPEQQINAIQQMVRQGVNGIMLMPLSGEPLAPAIDAAGKAHVPVVVMDNVIASSKYVINLFANKVPLGSAGAAGVVKNGNVLVVRGIPGNSVEGVINDGTLAAVTACPGLKVVGTVVGNWSASGAKTAITEFVTSHPGMKIDLVEQDGAMAAGVIDAFESGGTSVPVVSVGGCQGGELSWWLAHLPAYHTVGSCDNGFMVSHGSIRVLFRVLSGNGLKLRDISITTPVVTNANLAQFATAGQPLSWQVEARGPITGRCGSNACLNGFFVKPGGPKGF
jgi:ribose transport system substrate-binding protein